MHVALILARDGDDISINWIEAFPRKAGHGEQVIRDLLREAQARGVTVKAVPFGREPRLIEMYKRLGFASAGHFMKCPPPA